MSKKYLILVVVAMTSIAMACSTPVFRYAIERWEADPYFIYVFADGDLTGAQQQIVNEFRVYQRYGYRMSPVEVQVWDVTKLTNDALKVWSNLPENQTLPTVALGYPPIMRLRRPVWVDELSSSAVQRIAMSPARMEIAQRLLGGDAAVWLFVPGEDEEENQKIKKMVNGELRRLEQSIEYNADFLALAEEAGTGVPKLKFSMLELNRSDPAEQVFLSMLTQVSEEVEKYNGPLLIPIFGQGRATVIMMKEFLAEEHIQTVVEFLTGACACEIKALNPGFDLLIPVDWISGVTEEYVFDSEIPPLTSPSASMMDLEDNLPAPERIDVASVEVENDGSSLFTVMLGVLVVSILLVLGASTWWMMRKE